MRFIQISETITINKHKEGKKYTKEDREKTLESLTHFFKSVEKIRARVLLGSGTIGFTDDFYDLDFMLGVESSSDCTIVKDLILNKLQEMGYDFGKIIEFRKERYFIVAILNNFLELDISVVPQDEFVARSNQWKILFDKDDKAITFMTNHWKSQKISTPLEVINDQNLIVETTYLIRRSLIELARNNPIYSQIWFPKSEKIFFLLNVCWKIKKCINLKIMPL